MQAYRYEECQGCKQRYPNFVLDPHSASCYCLHCGIVIDDLVLLDGPGQYLHRSDIFTLFRPDGRRAQSAGYKRCYHANEVCRISALCLTSPERLAGNFSQLVICTHEFALVEKVVLLETAFHHVAFAAGGTTVIWEVVVVAVNSVDTIKFGVLWSLATIIAEAVHEYAKFVVREIPVYPPSPGIIPIPSICILLCVAPRVVDDC